VGGVGYLVGSVLLIPAFLTTNLALALPLVIVGAAFVSAPNSPGDAARLDVVPSRMWGRTEAIRTFLRTLLEAFAPLAFGFVSQMLGGAGAGPGSGLNSGAARISAASAGGISYTFLLMLAPLAGAGLLTLGAQRSYPTDVASAAASDDETRRASAATSPAPARMSGGDGVRHNRRKAHRPRADDPYHR
jgi:hypothetical protein